MLGYKEFKREVERIADYLNTTITGVSASCGNYTARLAECDAFDRVEITGRQHSRVIAFKYGDDHVRSFEVR